MDTEDAATCIAPGVKSCNYLCQPDSPCNHKDVKILFMERNLKGLFLFGPSLLLSRKIKYGGFVLDY